MEVYSAGLKTTLIGVHVAATTPYLKFDRTPRPFPIVALFLFAVAIGITIGLLVSR